jgi:hypothetical protein
MPLPADVLADPGRALPDVPAPKVEVTPVVELAQEVLVLFSDERPGVVPFDVVPGVMPSGDEAPSVVMVGGESPSKGLIPPLSISVAPRGIVPMRFDPAVDPGLDNGDAVPLEDNVVDGQLELEEANPVALDPPPSKVELVPDMLEPLVPDMLRVEEPADEQFALEAGLKPPGSISVAPNGTPVPLAPLDPGMPSGDVALIAGRVVIELCA